MLSQWTECLAGRRRRARRLRGSGRARAGDGERRAGAAGSDRARAEPAGHDSAARDRATAAECAAGRRGFAVGQLVRGRDANGPAGGGRAAIVLVRVSELVAAADWRCARRGAARNGRRAEDFGLRIADCGLMNGADCGGRRRAGIRSAAIGDVLKSAGAECDLVAAAK